MAKNKKPLTPEQEQERKLKKLRPYYESADDELCLAGMPVEEQVHKLVDACDTLLTEICSVADDIKINDFAKAQQITPVDKKTYMDFVNICAKKNNDSLKEQAVEKFTEDFERRLFITNLRHTFLESYMNGEPLQITDEDNEEYEPYAGYASDEFSAIMEDSAKKRDYLNSALWPRYKSFAKAAEYVTKLELTSKDFRSLVDWQHYADGGYPSPTSPSKVWAAFDKFNYTLRTLSRWAYDDVAKELCDEFGLTVEQHEQHPKPHKWQETDEL